MARHTTIYQEVECEASCTIDIDVIKEWWKEASPEERAEVNGVRLSKSKRMSLEELMKQEIIDRCFHLIPLAELEALEKKYYEYEVAA